MAKCVAMSCHELSAAVTVAKDDLRTWAVMLSVGGGDSCDSTVPAFSVVSSQRACYVRVPLCVGTYEPRQTPLSRVVESEARSLKMKHFRTSKSKPPQRHLTFEIEGSTISDVASCMHRISLCTTGGNLFTVSVVEQDGVCCIEKAQEESLQTKHVAGVAAGNHCMVIWTDTGELLTTAGDPHDVPTHHSSAIGHNEYVPVPAVLNGARMTVVGAAVGDAHTIFWTHDGQLFTHGWGQHGQLGHGDNEARRIATHVPNLQDKKVCGGAAGCMHSIVMTDQGEAFAFGSGTLNNHTAFPELNELNEL